jgi:hypothetical protein
MIDEFSSPHSIAENALHRCAIEIGAFGRIDVRPSIPADGGRSRVCLLRDIHRWLGVAVRGVLDLSNASDYRRNRFVERFRHSASTERDGPRIGAARAVSRVGLLGLQTRVGTRRHTSRLNGVRVFGVRMTNWLSRVSSNISRVRRKYAASADSGLLGGQQQTRMTWSEHYRRYCPAREAPARR